MTVGNFDGCHRGHQRLVAATVDHAARLRGLAIALTFAPRPEAFFRGVPAERLLFTEGQKSRALVELGIDCQIIQTFDAAFARLRHETFYRECLRETLAAQAVVVGDNFCFGHGRQGDASWLKARGGEDGIAVTIGEAAHHAGLPISSTRIRETLTLRGDMAEVSAMLGRPYLLEGTIRRGDQIGRRLGFPTANLEDRGQLIPRFGVYAGFVWLGGDRESARSPSVLRLPEEAVPAVFNIGIRPTVDRTVTPPVRIEAHLLRGQFAPDALYEREAGYYLTHRLRDELRFADLEALKSQIARDIATAKALTGGG